jgi:hypothetical protein
LQVVANLEFSTYGPQNTQDFILSVISVLMQVVIFSFLLGILLNYVSTRRRSVGERKREDLTCLNCACADREKGCARGEVQHPDGARGALLQDARAPAQDRGEHEVRGSMGGWTIISRLPPTFDVTSAYHWLSRSIRATSQSHRAHEGCCRQALLHLPAPEAHRRPRGAPGRACPAPRNPWSVTHLVPSPQGQVPASLRAKIQVQFVCFICTVRCARQSPYGVLDERTGRALQRGGGKRHLPWLPGAVRHFGPLPAQVIPRTQRGLLAVALGEADGVVT